MSSKQRPKLTRPADLGPSGRALWRQIAAWLREHDLILDPHERPLVEELCRTVDRLATLRAALATFEPADKEWTKLAGEERQQRLAYGRLVSALGLPSGVIPETAGTDRVVGLSPRSRRAQKAARARWGSRGPGGVADAQG